MIFPEIFRKGIEGMAKNKGYRVLDTVVTYDSRDEYPVVDSKDVAGGYHVTSTTSEMYSIPYMRRRLGMIVYVSNNDIEYRLVNNPTSKSTSISDWKEILQAKPLGFDISNYTLKSDFEQLKKDFITFSASSDLVKQSDLDKVKATIPNKDKVATKEELNTVKSSIPDISNLATKDEVNSKVTDIEDKIPDISNLATKDEVNNVETKIPDVSELVTQDELTASENNITSKIPDTSNLATKTEVENIKLAIPDTDEFATKEELDELKKTITSGGSSGGGTTIISGVTESEVDDKIDKALSVYPKPSDILTTTDLSIYATNDDLDEAKIDLDTKIDNISINDDVTQDEIDALFS